MSSWGVSFGPCNGGSGATIYVMVNEVEITVEESNIEVDVAGITIECNVDYPEITVSVEPVSLTTEISYGS